MTVKATHSKVIRSGVKVQAITGEYKGLTGKVLSRKGDKVIVEGLNLRKRHMKPTQETPGRVIEKEMPIHVSNLKRFGEDQN